MTGEPTDNWRVRGLRVPDGAPTEWWVQDGAIRSAPATGTGGPYVVEGGLVDAHVHLTFEPHDVFNLPRGSAELIRAGLGAHRRAGELIVRDAGSLPGNGPIDGVIGCGPFLAPPGHFSPHLYAGTEPGDAAEQAKRQIEQGWPWAKVILDFPGPGETPFSTDGS